MKTTIKATRKQAQARSSYEFAAKQAEAMATKGQPLVQDRTPPRTSQEIPSAPGFPF